MKVPIVRFGLFVPPVGPVWGEVSEMVIILAKVEFAANRRPKTSDMRGAERNIKVRPNE